jgi:hypothetical protein
MRTVAVTARTAAPREAAWQLLVDVAAYPGRVSFVRRVRLHGPLAVGARWDDLTTILWLPLWVRHTVTRLDPPRAFAFAVHLPGGGAMEQAFALHRAGPVTELRARVRFALAPAVVDAVLGPLLARRLTAMLASGINAARRDLAAAQEGEPCSPHRSSSAPRTKAVTSAAASPRSTARRRVRSR